MYEDPLMSMSADGRDETRLVTPPREGTKHRDRETTPLGTDLLDA